MSTERLETLIEAEVEKRIAERDKASARYAEEDEDGRIYVVVRCTGAGIHAGYVDADLLDGNPAGAIVIYNARRIWRYFTSGIGSCTDIAYDGLKEGEPSRVQRVIPKFLLSSWVEVIPATEKARRSIEGWRSE